MTTFPFTSTGPFMLWLLLRTSLADLEPELGTPELETLSVLPFR